MIEHEGKKYDGYISEIQLANGQRYLLRAKVVEVYPITCPKCGALITGKFCTECGAEVK